MIEDNISNSKKSYLMCGNTGIIGKQLTELFKGTINIEGLNRLNFDFTNIKMINKYFNKNRKKYDGLIFLIGIAHSKGKKKDIGFYRKNNVETLKNLMIVLEKYNIVPEILIYASTISIYGENYNNKIIDEKAVKKPKSPYAITKLEAEDYLKKTYPNSSWILRFSPVYHDTFFLNIHRRTKIKKIYFKVGDGGSKISLCNILNIKKVIFSIIKGKVPFGTYNISDSINYTYNDLLKLENPTPIRIPTIFIKLSYLFSLITGNNFLRENSIKLITDNVYSAKKISKYVKLNENIRKYY